MSTPIGSLVPCGDGSCGSCIPTWRARGLIIYTNTDDATDATFSADYALALALASGFNFDDNAPGTDSPVAWWTWAESTYTGGSLASTGTFSPLTDAYSAAELLEAWAYSASPESLIVA